MTDNFQGDNNALVRSIKALLELDAKGALVPHGIGGHARSLLSAAASRLVQPAASVEPVAWYTDDNLSDKSATTWDKRVAERWLAKGWPVDQLYIAPVAAQPSVPNHLIERLKKHCDDKSNTAFARSSMREALQYLSKDA